MKNTIANKMSRCRTLIFNSKDPQILELLETVGIDEAYIDVGIILYTETEERIQKKSEDYQGQNLTYDTYYTEKDTVKNMFNKRLKMVKVLARNDQNLQDRLKLKTGRAFAIEEWVEKGIELYVLLNNESDFLTKLAERKVTAEVLASEKEAFERIKTLKNKVTADKGQAQEATRIRNEKLEELEDFCSELRAMAEIAIDGKSQLLEKLGLVVR